jgi:signal peptidase II
VAFSKMPNFLKKSFYINCFIVILIFVLDRVTKIYVINFYDNNLGNDLLNSKYLNIRLIWNEGIAFGLFSFDEKIFYDILTLLIGLVIIIIFLMLKTNEGLKKYSLLIILGGASGNFYDRVKYNAVPDFIDFHIENFHWFIFNVSDIFITIGVILMIVLELISNKKENINEKN